jgi:hypothetical protein
VVPRKKTPPPRYKVGGVAALKEHSHGL